MSRRSQRKPRNPWPVLELVEPRYLRTASLANGVLTVTGTVTADDYYINYNSLTGTIDVTNHGTLEGRFA
jgi:hypothetical protein